MFRRNIIFLLSILICFSVLFFGCNGEEQKNCPKCGENIQNNMNFCPNCGFEIKYDDSGNILEVDNANSKNKIIIEIQSKWVILKYLDITFSITEQTPTLISNPDTLTRYHISTTVTITTHSKSRDYLFDNAYLCVFYLTGGRETSVKIYLDQEGYGSGTMLLLETAYSPIIKYNFPIDSCVNDAGGTISYYE